mgnify:FL=1
MKKIYLSITLALLLVGQTTYGQVLTFKNWKALQILESQQGLKRANADQLYQALLKVELSKDLTINDYFIVYLSRHHDGKGAIMKAAKKMSPDETASLLLAYRSNLQEKSETSPTVSPELSPKAPVESQVSAPSTKP